MHILIGLGIVAALIGFVAGETAARVFVGLCLAFAALLAGFIIFVAVCDGCMGARKPAYVMQCQNSEPRRVGASYYCH